MSGYDIFAWIVLVILLAVILLVFWLMGSLPRTLREDQGGSITIRFGGCEAKLPNCLPIMKGWNYMVRLYQPREEILTGAWKFPDPQPVNQ